MPVYEFGPFELDSTERWLRRDGIKVPIFPKIFDVLVFLVHRSGRLVEKHELSAGVWNATFVEEGSICVAISTLRKMLGVDDNGRKYIETISKHGYRFVGDVRVRAQENALTRVFEQTDKNHIPASRTEGPMDPESPPQQEPPQLTARVARAAQERGWRSMALEGLPGRLGLITLLALTIAGALYSGWPKRHSVALATETAPFHSLAVLPFTTVGDPADNKYLGVGMSTEVTTRLANLHKILIRPSGAMAKYAASSRDPVSVAREQGVDAVLDGQIQHLGDRIQLAIQLIRASDGIQIWGDEFDEQYTDIFSMQNNVSRAVAESIRLNLTSEDERLLARHSTKNRGAYEAYVKGHFFMDKRTDAGLKKSLEYYREAVASDPGYSEAYAGMAASYALLGLYAGLPPNQAFPEARHAALAALQLDPGLSAAHTTLGFVSFYYDWDCVVAEQEFKQAQLTTPDDPIAHTWRGLALAIMGRNEDAVHEASLAIRADPLSPVISTNAGFVLDLAGKREEAIAAFRNAIEVDANFPRAHYRLGNAYLHRNMPVQALAELQSAVKLSGDDPYYEAALGQAYAVSGKRIESRRILRHLREEANSRYVPPYAVAQVYAGLGEKDEAFSWLARAYQDRSTSLVYLKIDRSFENLRSDPRYSTFAHRLVF
ncbi:MAG: transcriptional regulator, CadC [Edaphobacter sp.]|nr:transcriptional regulator, CadC [Edaphobacter sp.]